MAIVNFLILSLLAIYVRSSSSIPPPLDATHRESLANYDQVKLPAIAQPQFYDLYIRPDLGSFTFQGKEAIHLVLIESTKALTLHSNQLSILSSSLTLRDGRVFVIESKDIVLNEKATRLTLNLPETIPPQEILLNLTFQGEINDKMRGFSRSSYKVAGNDSKQHLVSTKFESTYARMAFPCWDEPVYKANFSITLEVDRKLTALSNMNQISSEELEGDMKLVKFATTPKMSTYLVAFAVGDFEFIESRTNAGVTVRVYTVRGKKDAGQFALEVATRCLDWYNEWFGIRMPLPKCDLLAVPDFASGAMENWGLVTYREYYLLMDQAKSSTLTKIRIAQVIAHELAHFWFGNLVTMKWWTDLWLKEGFASFMEYVFVGKNYPEFNVWPKFLENEQHSAFSFDSLRNSHPIEVPINDPNELDEIYDSITYEKSNSIIRMLFNYLGEETFQKGLQIYLNRFRYGNAITVDLWNALSEASGQVAFYSTKVDINKLMNSWTGQVGFPIVSVQRNNSESGAVLSLQQHRFLADGSSNSSSVWQIPIVTSTAWNPKEPGRFKFLLNESSDNFLLVGSRPVDWIKLNSFSSGFFRVHYSDDMLDALMPAFRPSDRSDVDRRLSERGPIFVPPLESMDRYGFVSDLFASVKIGRTNVSKFLNIYREAIVQSENSYVVWTALDNGIKQLGMVMDCLGDEGRLKARFNEFIRLLLERIVKSLPGEGWEQPNTNDGDQMLLQALMLNRLLKVGHEPTMQIAISKFRAYVANKTEIHPDLRGLVFYAVAKSNDPKGVADLKKIIETINFSEVEAQAIRSLGQVTDPVLLADVYNYGIIEGKIRPQDMTTLFLGTSSTGPGKVFIWNFFKQNVNRLIKIYGKPTASLFRRCFQYSTYSQCSETVARDAEEFFVEHFNEGAKASLNREFRRLMEKIRVNEYILQVTAKQIDEYLNSVEF